ncbi:MAG: OmpH family outer membrane protein [Bacteroidales bacterium]
MNKQYLSIFLSSIAVLFSIITLVITLRTTSSGTTISTTSENDTTKVNTLPPSQAAIVYVNTDSMMLNYLYYKELDEILKRKHSRMENDYNRKMKALEEDIYDYQTKAQKGLFTRNEMLEKEQGLQVRQQEMMKLNEKLSSELMDEQEAMQHRLLDSVRAVLKDFNKNGRFQIILNNAYNSSVLMAQESLNITDTILIMLNSRYKKSINPKSK